MIQTYTNMYCVDTYQYKLIWLPLSDLTGSTWMKHRRVGCEIVEEELPAMRGYHRVEEAKTEGCMADGLRCNIWARAGLYTDGTTSSWSV